MKNGRRIRAFRQDHLLQLIGQAFGSSRIYAHPANQNDSSEDSLYAVGAGAAVHSLTDEESKTGADLLSCFTFFLGICGLAR